MDIADIAAEREQIDTARAIAAARNPLQRQLSPTGQCHNCEEPLAHDQLFCDQDCRDDWQKRDRMRGFS